MEEAMQKSTNDICFKILVDPKSYLHEKIEIFPTNSEYFTLDELQKIVGGMIEIVPSNNPDYSIILNEEGKLLDLPINYVGTYLTRNVLSENDYIVGNIGIIHNKFIK